METKAENIDQYIAGFKEDIQSILQKVRETISKAAPEASEEISYGMPAFRYLSKPLVYFAAFKNHIGFYALPDGNVAFAEKLKGFKVGKGSIQFPLDKPIPYDLIEEIVKFRLEEIEKNGK